MSLQALTHFAASQLESQQTLFVPIPNSSIVQILLLGILGFALAMALTPIYTTVAFKKQWWKQQRSEAWSGGAATVYHKLHAAKHKQLIPTMGGMIFVVSVCLVTLFFNLDRGQTWLPLAGMAAAGLIGLVDDFINIKSNGNGLAGMRAPVKFGLYSIVALIGGWWFFAKLGVDHFFVPGIGHIFAGVFIVLIFWFVVVATGNSVNISDGLDGLAGGLLAASFMAYAIICLVEQKYALSGFCITVVGALLSYTWFNIFPARFMMGDVGAFAMGTALGIIAMQTDTIYVLPVIGGVYVMETGSVIINRLSRKLRHGKRVFLSSPIHHHFEAIGWPETKVTMRFWVLGQICGVVGLILFLIGHYS